MKLDIYLILVSYHERLGNASITEDAKRLAELIGNKEPIAPLKNPEPNIEDKDGAYKSLLENLNLEGE